MKEILLKDRSLRRELNKVSGLLDENENVLLKINFA